ncbi:MAG TPA: queuosine salvage family protein [Gaiellaceae bacterium]|nr:queuosine salvage family protein [Gaiellaceae bacterium]
MAHPVLDSVLPVVAASRDVSLDPERLAEHTGWMAYEELPRPPFLLPFPLELDRAGIADFVLTATCINFAFTDFETRVRWEVVHDGRVLADADGMHFCLQRALAEGVPVLDGAWLRDVSADDLRRIFRRGNSELQLLDERARIWREVGATLVERYDGRFSNLLAAAGSCSEFLELLTRDFPRFDDTAVYDGEPVRFWKLAQLSVWILEASLPGGTGFGDLYRLTAFADYIVPAALRVLGITRYSDELETAIREGRLIEAGSPWEVEIRAHTIHACDELCRRINELRPPDLQVIVPQVDARLWVPYHRTHYPHHLTRTRFY